MITLLELIPLGTWMGENGNCFPLRKSLKGLCDPAASMSYGVQCVERSESEVAGSIDHDACLAINDWQRLESEFSFPRNVLAS